MMREGFEVFPLWMLSPFYILKSKHFKFEIVLRNFANSPFPIAFLDIICYIKSIIIFIYDS